MILANSESPVLLAALSYANRDWPVLPLHGVVDGGCTCGRDDCPSPGKHPLTPRGVLNATTDEATIRRWLEKAPTANVAIRTGPEPGVLSRGQAAVAGITILPGLRLAWSATKRRWAGCPSTFAAKMGTS